MPKLDAAYAEQMSPEEIAAYEAEDEIAAEEAVAALAARGAPDEDAPKAEDPEPSDPETEDAGSDHDPEDPPAAETKEAEPDPEPAKAGAPKAPPTPQIDVAAAQKALEDAKAERKKLREQYDDGDLTDAEYDEAIDKLDDIAGDARAALKLHEHQQQQEAASWEEAGKAYLEQYPGLKEPGVAEAMNLAIQDLSKLPSLGNLSDAEFLDRVHRKLLADAVFTGLEIPEIKGGKGKTSFTPPPPKGDPSLGTSPKTLADVSASDVERTTGGKFAWLERLADADPARHEKEFMRLSEQDQNDYLEGAG